LKCLCPILNGGDTFMVGAVSATKITAAGFNAVTDDFAAAVFARRRQGVNGTFKTVEIVRDSVGHDFQWFVVLVSAYFALHKNPLGFSDRGDLIKLIIDAFPV
jgi:hypothetical protein